MALFGMVSSMGMGIGRLSVRRGDCGRIEHRVGILFWRLHRNARYSHFAVLREHSIVI